MQKNDGKEVLILGITGGYGQAMANEMVRAGWRVRALVRDQKRAEASLAGTLLQGITLIEGDALSQRALNQAAQGVDVIVFGINVPYGQWASVMATITEHVALAASSQGATIAFPGNVYSFAPDTQITPETPMRPPNVKGELRQDMEQRLAQAATDGAQVITLRGGDFFGTSAQNSWMRHILGKVHRGRALQMPRHEGVRHGWAYLPDFVRTHVALLQMRQDLPKVATFHFRGHVLTEEELVDGLGQVLENGRPKVSHLPWWFIRLGGIWSANWKGLVQMRYLWDEEVLMDQHLLEDTLTHVPHTPLPQALRHELEAAGMIR